MEDIGFSPEQHKTWAELYRRQLPKIQAHACVGYSVVETGHEFRKPFESR